MIWTLLSVTVPEMVSTFEALTLYTRPGKSPNTVAPVAPPPSWYLIGVISDPVHTVWFLDPDVPSWVIVSFGLTVIDPVNDASAQLLKLPVVDTVYE